MIDELEAISGLPESPRDKRTDWADRLKRSHPDRHKSLMVIVDDYRNGGTSMLKLRTVSNLFRYLSGRDPDRPIKTPLLPPDLTYNTFRRFVNEQRS